MKAAIAGCGAIAEVHAQCLSKLDGVELTAFADIRSDRAESFAKRYGGASYCSISEMLAFEKPDVLHICLPHDLHVPAAIQAMTAGVHVFLEKPPVMNREQLKQLQTTQQCASVQLGLCFQNRYNLCTQAVKQLLLSGKAGSVLGVRGFVTWSRGKDYYRNSGWRGSLAREGGGVLINQSVHTLDLMTYFAGKPEEVEASMQNHHLKGVIEVEDTMEAYIRYENGVPGCFYATTAYSADPKPIIELHCEKMTIRMEDPDVWLYDLDGKKEALPLARPDSYGKTYWGGGHAACIADFYHCLKQGERFSLNLETLNDTIRLMLACYESARLGKVFAV